MCIKMTYKEALSIQEEQVRHWSRVARSQGQEEKFKAKVKAETKPCPFDPREARSVREINKLVPRGFVLECWLGFHIRGEQS